MAKLTLTFKGKPIRAYQFDAGESASIGRNDENQIQIDSLAVAPIHAVIQVRDGQSIISQEHGDFPLQVNNTQTARHELQHGDQISIGKHVLYFTEETTVLDIPSPRSDRDFDGADHKLLDEEIKQSSQSVDGQLQILNGRNIGRVISLKAGMTRLGKPETGVAVIAKRKDGFYIASLDGGAQIKLNGQAVHDRCSKLNQGDLLEIDRTEMQFFVQEFSPQFEDI
jgi:pSer/pThr/pTyr-binding forkhead associated (FHA) protein